MFILAIISSIIVGYLLRGRIKNLENLKISGIHLIFISFGIEFLIVMFMRKGIFSAGIITYAVDLVMYLILFTFILKNKKNPFILLMGMGFLLNSIPIFLNSGTMPVSVDAMNAVGINSDISREGLYSVITEGTRVWILADIIPFNFIVHVVVSIGDIVAAIGLILLIITGMRKSEIKSS